MSLTDALRKLGILRTGAESYKGTNQTLGEFYDSPARSDGKPADTPAPAVARTAPRGGVGSGRKVFFILSLLIAALCVVVVTTVSGLSIWSLLTLLVWIGYVVYAASFAYGGSGRSVTVAGIFVLAVLLSLGFMAAVAPDVETTSTAGKSTVETEARVGLEIDRIAWASVSPNEALYPISGNRYDCPVG